MCSGADGDDGGDEGDHVGFVVHLSVYRTLRWPLHLMAVPKAKKKHNRKQRGEERRAKSRARDGDGKGGGRVRALVQCRRQSGPTVPSKK